MIPGAWLRSRPGGLGAALVATLLWLFAASTADNPVFGAGIARTGVTAAAVVATAVALVLGGSWLILNLGSARRGGAPATGMHRVLVHLIVALAVSYVVLEYFGFDVRAILATSAIVTAAIGLAMQPTLGSMISGIALSGDRTLRVGDGILRGGEALRVESMNWRNVIARRADGTMLVLPNAKLSDADLEILPHDRSIRSEIVVKLPASVPPQLIGALASELVADCPLLDRARPVTAAPLELEAGSALTRYRIRYWVARYRDMAAAEADVLRRLWYGLRRHQVTQADASAEPTAAPGCAQAEIAPLIRASPPAVTEAQAEQLAASGECLLYAPGERLTLPEHTESWRFLLLRGQAEARVEVRVTGDGSEPAGPDLTRDGRVAAVQRIVRELAKWIGPYAEYAVTRAARVSASLDDLCGAVAQEIPDGPSRAAFLAALQPDPSPTFGPGLRFGARRDAAGTLVCDQWLQAKDEVLVLAVPPDLAPLLAEPAPDEGPAATVVTAARA